MAEARTTALDLVVGEVIESVFDTVEDILREALHRHRRHGAAGGLTEDDVRAMVPGLHARLREPGQLAVGMGLILEPGLLPSQPLCLEWWQQAAGSEEPVRLEVDLHPDSLDFYDYAATDWFAIPRRTHRRHVVGPYVDVHGTDRYLLTLTMPIEADGVFLGVAGADVPLTRFESVVLGCLGSAVEAVLTNGEGRVVLSTSSRWITGSLVSRDERRRSRSLPNLPWGIYEPVGSSPD